MPLGAVPLDRLLRETTAFVDPWRIPDLAPTGLQVRVRPDNGNDPIARVALAVSTTTAVIDRASDWDAQLLLVHHGMFWGTLRLGYDPETDPARRWDLARVDRLRERGVNIAAYHLPLDAHTEVGNNVELARRLGLTVVASDLGSWPGTRASLGVRTEAAVPLSADELGTRARAAFGPEVIVVPGKAAGIRTVGIVCGGASRMIHEVIDRGLDAWVTGEAEVWAYDLAFDAGVTLIVVGHHRSERYGVQALGGWLARRFGIETRFFDEANPF